MNARVDASGAGTSAGAVEVYVGALERTLRGPAGVRRGMLAEVRDGLLDAADAHRRGGLPAPHAAERAVREFGTVAELAPQLQGELTVAQGRRTAALVALLFPAMLMSWNLLWAAHPVPGESLDPVGELLTRGVDVVSGVVAACAVGLLVVSSSRRVRPRPTATAVAALGLSGVLLCGAGGVGASVAATSAGPSSIAVLTGLPGLAAFALSGVAVLAVLTSAARSLRLVARG